MTKTAIHRTAIVHANARLADDVEIGPFTVIGEHVEIGAGTVIGSHAVITGRTRIGRNNKISQFVSLGEVPQDKKYDGEPTRLEIGDNNVIREFCTFNLGTAQDRGVTTVGNDNWIMAYVHLAHDCDVQNNTVIANLCGLSGHVTLEDHVILGGNTLIHQFCRIGAHAFTAGGSIILRDVPPYVMAAGTPSAEPKGINSEGLKRRGFSPETIEEIRRAYKTLYRNGLSLEDAKRELAEQARTTSEIAVLVRFLESSERGIIR